MKHPTVIMLFLLSAIICQPGSGVAEQNNFDIDIKELHPTPAKQSRRAPHVKTREKNAVATDSKEGFSSYTVRPGDHLFLILMRHYGLSNNAAERLIPEVMRLNGIQNPHGLTVGKRLTIPLPLQQERSVKLARKNTEPTAQTTPEQPSAQGEAATQEQAAQPEQPLPQEQTTQPAPQEQPITVQPTEQTETGKAQVAKSPETVQEPQTQPAHNTVEQQITLKADRPCTLARNMAKEMGLLEPGRTVVQGADSFTAEYAGVTVVVACGLTSEETYTYGRLLTQPDMHLLVFARNESCKNVIEKMARLIGLSYLPADPFATGGLPLTYLFPAIGPNSHDVRLTIVP